MISETNPTTAVDIRILEHPAALEQVVDLEILVWGLSPRDAVPSNLLHVLAVQGGLVLGAFASSELVGTALAFPVRRGSRWLLWSHMVAVHPAYQGQGIGFALKQAQRAWALERRYSQMAWTFDPLQRGNANFNLHLLGAAAHVYHENFYGEMTDSLNAGLPSDRLEAVWNLKDKRVERLLQAGAGISRPIADPDMVMSGAVLRMAPDGVPVIDLEMAERNPECYAEIPDDLSHLRSHQPELALQWRLALRAALTHAFRAGYIACDFINLAGRWWYVLRRAPAWFLYVLECADGTMYTGITDHLERRLASHNTGRGAAYTAARRPVKLIGLWRFPDRSTALRAEAAFKRLHRDEKIVYVERRSPFRGAAFVEFDQSVDMSNP